MFKYFFICTCSSSSSELCPRLNSQRNWAAFHFMEFETRVLQLSNLSEFLQKDCVKGLYLTCDCHPSPALMAQLFNRKNLRSNVELRIDARNCAPSFWFFVAEDEEEEVVKFADLAIFSEIAPSSLREQREEVYRRMYDFNFEDMSLHEIAHQRYQICSDFIVRCWHSIDSNLSRKLYMMIWLDAFQRNPGIGNFDWVKSQSIFCPVIKYTSLKWKQNEDKSVSQALKRILKENSLDFDSLLRENVQGVQLEADLAHSEVANSPFSLQGLVNLISLRSEDEVDTSITMVGFYFDLGYSEKKPLSYYNSLKKYCTVKHPLVYFGTQESCQKVQEHRSQEGLAEFTIVVESTAADFPVVQKYREDFAAADTDLPFNRRRRYAIMTSIKIEAVMAAISRADFASDFYAWYDPGIYKYEHLTNASMVSVPLFSHLASSLKENRISILSITSEPGTQTQDVKDGVENILAAIFCGKKEAWQKLSPLYAQVRDFFFAQGIFRTEQVLLSRLIAIKPTLFQCFLCGLDYKRFEEALSLKNAD